MFNLSLRQGQPQGSKIIRKIYRQLLTAKGWPTLLIKRRFLGKKRIKKYDGGTVLRKVFEVGTLNRRG